MRLEQLHGELLADLPFAVVRHPELADVAERPGPRLLELAELGLAQLFLLDRLKAHLERLVAVPGRLPELEDRARPGLNRRHRLAAPVVVVDVRHAEFFAEQSDHLTST